MQTSVFSVHSSLLHMNLTVNTLPSPILANGGLGKSMFEIIEGTFYPKYFFFQLEDYRIVKKEIRLVAMIYDEQVHMFILIVHGQQM